eukprot:jgi/Tetstr1/444631/TSEL_032479.t1
MVLTLSRLRPFITPRIGVSRAAIATPVCSSVSPAPRLASLREGAARAGRRSGLWAAASAASARRPSIAAMAADTKTVLVPVADGCEEMEAVIVIDVLVRAGANVTVASVDGPVVTCSRGVKLQADTSLADVAAETYDLIAVPGGMPGAEHFRDCEQLIDMLRQQKEAGRLYAAICASPAIVLEHHGLLSGQPATSHPAFQERLANQGAVKERVVEVGNSNHEPGPWNCL